MAGKKDSPEADRALATLCEMYWYPLYAFVRRQGYSSHDAQDLTQGFFARLLQRDDLKGLDPRKGKFRAFLLASLKHFIANEWDRTQTQKRGGGQTIIHLDAKTAEERYALEPVDEMTPERLYERRWADTILQQVFTRLRLESDAAGKSQRFDELRPFLMDEPSADSYAEAANRLGMTESAVKSAAHRMRQRVGELLREEIGHTVADSREIDGEIRCLLAALAA